MDDFSGQELRGYRLREMIGAGGFGSVYRAYQSIVNREVAIKVIQPQFANHPEFVRRFEVEAQLIARLEHPHIVPLYDYWREPRSAYLVMRWLRGGNLGDMTLGDSVDLSLLVALIEQIASALAIAHRNDVVHQDIKPANILLDEDRNAYLTDFGIARDLRNQEDGAKANTKQSFGSPPYMSPEAILREPITPQSDIYSLGIVLYELLTGRLPFFDEDINVVLHQHVHEPLPPVKFNPPHLMGRLNMIIRRATAKIPEARYQSVLDLAVDFRQLADTESGVSSRSPRVQEPGQSFETGKVELGTMDVSALGTMEVSGPLEPANPYKGLRAFEEADAADFFGREPLVEQLLRRLAEPGDMARFLAVVGPSGSGKSSVINAGLVPALRAGEISGPGPWFIAKMVPGAQPFIELEQALLRVALNEVPGLMEHLRTDTRGLCRAMGQILPADDTVMLLVIDQFEEIFTLVEDEAERTHFLKNLFNAVMEPDGRLRLVVALRADFYDRPLLYSGFGDLIRERTEVVLPLSSNELARAVTSPAERVGLQVEKDLLAAIVTDLDEQPGALPLLQYALTELFEQRDGDALSLQGYRESGGVSGALARRAEELYETLDEEHRRATRQLFLRLIALGDGVEDTRRRVRWDALISIAQSDRETMQSVIDRFAKYRLLTLDRDPQTREPTVEVAHEALIRTWERLRGWLAESREDLLAHRRLAAATAEWVNAGRDPSFLATGARLAQFEPLAGASVSLNEDELAYVQASVARRQRQRNRVRLVVAVLAGFSIMVTALAIFAIDRQNRAIIERDRADRQASVSRSRELAMTALTNLDRVDLALLLSLEALDAADTFEAKNSLLTALQAQSYLDRFLHGHTDHVRTVVFSPDGRLCAAGSRDNMVIVWDVETGRVVETLTGHAGWVNRVAFGPEGRLLASGSEDGTVRLWNISRETEARVLEGHTGAVWGIAFSPDGRLLASSGADSAILLWDVETGEPAAEPIFGHGDLVYAVAFSPDGAVLASGGADGSVRLWDVSTGEPLGGPLLGHTNWVLDVAFGPSGLLASGGADGGVIFWNIETGQPIGEPLSGHRGWVRSVAFGLDGRLLVSGGADGSVILWSVANVQAIGQLVAVNDGAVWDVAVHPERALVASGGTDRAVGLWDLSKIGILSRILAEQEVSISDVAFSPDGRALAAADSELSGRDSTVHLWDVETGEELRSLSGHGGAVSDIAFSPDGGRLASGTADGAVLLWDMVGEDDILFQHGKDSVLSVTFSPDGEKLASGGVGGDVILWDLTVQDPAGEQLGRHEGGVHGLAFSPDSKLLASGGQDAVVTLWELGTDTARRLEGHTGTVWDVAFSPDGRLLASGDRDAVIIIWDVETGQLVTRLSGHTDWVNGLAFSPNGEMLASAGSDGVVMLWDVKTWRIIGEPLRAHDGWVNSVVFSPDGEILVSGGQDGMVVLWQVSLDVWQRRACEVANRSLRPDEQIQYGLDGQTCPDAP